MSDTYFSTVPTSADEEIQFVIAYAGRDHLWASSSGIFARDRLDPGTRLLLDASTGMVARRVLDLGCGHGALGLLHLDRQGSGFLVALDPNPRACRATEVNRRRLGVRGMVIQGFVADPLATGAIDLVLTNPPIRAGLEVLRRFWSGAARVLAPGGQLAFVGRPRQGGRRLAALAEEALGAAVEKLARHKGYEVYRIPRA